MSILFWIKKTVGGLIMPYSLVGLLLPLGLAALFVGRRKLGRGLLLGAVGLLYLFSLSPVADLLARPLENRFPVIDPDKLPPDLAAVIVLSGGVNDRPELPPAARLGSDTLQRTLEGIRIWRARPESSLILCGGEWRQSPDLPPPGKLMGDLARSLNVEPEKIVREVVSRDTFENAVEAARLLGGGPFVVVTSARHLPRAMAVFHRLGLKPIPAPTDHKIRAEPGRINLLPSLSAMASCQESIHEYLGLVWYRLRGRV